MKSVTIASNMTQNSHELEQTKDLSEKLQETKTITGKRKFKSAHWTEDEDKKLFELFKKLGTRWSMIIKYFDDRSENDVKNRFYSTLRRVATKKRREDPELLNINPNSKTDLVKYVDDALHYGHDCFSKRGRMRRDLIEKLKKDSISQKAFDPEDRKSVV